MKNLATNLLNAFVIVLVLIVTGFGAGLLSAVVARAFLFGWRLVN